MGESPRRRALRWLGLVVAGFVELMMLLAVIGLVGQAASSKPLPRGDSRSADVIIAAICLVIGGLCGVWMARAGRRLRARGRGGGPVSGGGPGSAGLSVDTAARADGHDFSGLGGGGLRWGIRGRRGRRGKPLSEMTADELRRAMWLTPLVVGTAILAGVTRIAMAAIEEELALWLAVLLILLIVAWPAALTIRVRRRYRARLAELRDPITGSLPAAGSLPPLPLRVRLWLVAAPVLAAVVLVLVANAPGAGNTCVTNGIATAAAREGVCKHGANLFGGGVTYNVVDAGSVLSMPGYEAQLLGTAGSMIRVEGVSLSTTLYPNRQGFLVSLELKLTDDGARPLELPVKRAIEVLIPDSPGSQQGTQWWPAARLTAGPTPQLDAQMPLPAGQSRVGWVSFILPLSIETQLHARLSDLDFYPADGSGDYIGQIRLWKAANAAGAAALQFRMVPNSPL